MTNFGPIITLTTDFGEASPYVACMKGVILGINPQVRLVDLSHQIPPQDIRHAAFFLAAAIPCFASDVLHVTVVDPGVGTERALLYIEIGGHRLLAPDNGCWTTLACSDHATRVIRLTEPCYWQSTVSSTFHGRDILAPVAAHLSQGLDPGQLGPQTQEWVRLGMPLPKANEQGILGEIVFIDHFGNLISNIPASQIPSPPDLLLLGRTPTRRRFRWVGSYGEAKEGSLVALISSTNLLEIAEVQGNAARRLGATVGTPVAIGWRR